MADRILYLVTAALIVLAVASLAAKIASDVMAGF